MLFFHPFLDALAGGALIGVAAGSFYLLHGRIAGISSIARAAVMQRGSGWRWAFMLGLLIAGFSYRLAGGMAPEALTKANIWLLLAGGLIVGFGSGLGNGCTSGHGVCGIARLSSRSIVAVLVFMATASVTVYLTRHWGAY